MLLLLVLAQMPAMPGQPMGPIVSSPASSRSSAPSYAFFEFAPASGAGMGTECACTTPTGAKGEAMTFVRVGGAMCTPGTNSPRATNFADNSLVTCATDQPRIERNAAGTLALRGERQITNVVQRFIELTDAIWTDVGTPSLTGGQTSPWVGTYATSAVTIDDNDAAGFEGRSQNVTVSAGVAHTAHCYVKAGTATSASIVLDGTTSSVTGLATNRWDIVEVTDASSSGTSIAFATRVGNATTVTGSVVWGGCQVEAGGYRTSMVPTGNIAVTRSPDDRPYVGVSAFSPRCIGATLQPLWASATANRRAVRVDTNGADTVRWELYVSGATLASFATDGTNSTTATQAVSGLPALARLVGLHAPATTLSAVANGAQTNAATLVTALNINRVYLGGYAGSSGYEADGLVSNVVADPDITRCSP